MPDQRFPSVRWTDTDAVAKAIEALEREGRVRIDLPPDFHHSLFAHVCRGADVRHEYVDVSGGPELLAKVLEIRLLAELEPLLERASALSAKVHIQSPAPRIFVERE